jgi:hypothetical protein
MDESPLPIIGNASRTTFIGNEWYILQLISMTY